MLIHLLQEEVTIRLVRIGKRLGLVDISRRA